MPLKAREFTPARIVMSSIRMRTRSMLVVCAALTVACAADALLTGRCLAQSGPLPTAALNPRLGAPPPGGHLSETMPRPGVVVPNAGATVQPGTSAGPADRLGTPPVAAVPNAATGAVPPPARVVPDAPAQAAPAVPPAAAGGVPAAGR